MDNTKQGILIAFEGIDGTGKSTQVKLLADYLRGRGYEVVETREPTDGPWGKKIRALFTNRQSVTPEEELDLFIHDREQHVREVVNPALAKGKVVLTDRYYFSTAAYQGAAGMDPDEVFRRNAFAPVPDLVLLLTMAPEESLVRVQELRGETLNDFEQEEQLRRVADLFDSFSDPCIRRIPAGGTLEEVRDRIRRIVDRMLEEKEQARVA
ncbi:MAG: hypothetical protein Kow0089_10480 [Desulfobulbaceae bacterium]